MPNRLASDVTSECVVFDTLWYVFDTTESVYRLLASHRSSHGRPQRQPMGVVALVLFISNAGYRIIGAQCLTRYRTAVRDMRLHCRMVPMYILLCTAVQCAHCYSACSTAQCAHCYSLCTHAHMCTGIIHNL